MKSSAAAINPRVGQQQSRAVRWTVGVGVAVIVAIGLVLLFLLTQATNNRDLYERNYERLFAINVVVAALLLLVICWIAFRLVKRLVQGRFGSRLLVRLAAVFALAGFVPGVLRSVPVPPPVLRPAGEVGTLRSGAVTTGDDEV